MKRDRAPSGTAFCSKLAQLDRPKSTPLTLRTKRDQGSSLSRGHGVIDNRPKTALGMTRPDFFSDVYRGARPRLLCQHRCDRVHQVERESTRKHNFEAHLPIKKPRTPPWQQKLDCSPTPCVVAPGYLLSRSKSKIAMYIKTDEFFDPQQDPHKGGHRSDSKTDPLVADLQRQIDDLSLFLEEEKLNHRETKRKGADQLRDKMAQLRNEHESSMQMLTERYEEQIEKLQKQHTDVLSQQAHNADTTIAKQRGEMEFLQGAFESYKGGIRSEMEERWKSRETELQFQFEDQIQKAVHGVRTEMISEHGEDKAELGRRHEEEVLKARREHKKELDGLIRRFSSVAADLERLKTTEARLREVEEEAESLKAQYDIVCSELGERTQELTDTKVELINFEQKFEERVKEVDERYKERIHNLMIQNTELRRLYVKKCSQLFEEKATSEVTRMERTVSAKETMRKSLRQ